MRCRKIREHAAGKKEGPAQGAVRQAFLCSLRQELSDFYRLLAVLEGQAGNPLPDGSEAAATAPYLTLRRLLVWLAEPLVSHTCEYLALIPPALLLCFLGRHHAG